MAVQPGDFFVNNRKGVLIAHEGISGSGKSESARRLYGFLRHKYHKTTVIEWNSNKTIRHIVRKLNDKRMLTPALYSIFQWTGFFIDYFTRMIPLLKRGYIIIADRYIYTALTRDAVNGAGLLSSRILYHMVRKPDLLFFYDTHPQVCYKRINARGKLLFHTNRYILENRLLKNKDLFYLKKLKNEYVRLLSSPEVKKHANIIFIGDNYNDVGVCVNAYLTRKLNGT